MISFLNSPIFSGAVSVAIPVAAPDAPPERGASAGASAGARRVAGRVASRGRRRGAALIEFAMVSVIFLTMLLGMLQFGIYLSATNTLWNGAREGARVAAVTPASVSTTEANNAIKNRIAQTISPLDAQKMAVTITPTESGDRAYGTAVTVQIRYDMSDKLFIPMPSAWFGRGLGKTYVTTATMRKEN